MKARVTRRSESCEACLSISLVIEERLSGRVKIDVRIGTPVEAPRAEWAAARSHPGRRLDAAGATRFDDEEWEW